MARPAKFSTEDLLDGALRVAGEHWRNATITQVAEEVGAPVGSIYHRFGSREELFGGLWLRSIERFHQALLAELRQGDPLEALVSGATLIPRYCRENPLEAIAMTLYRQPELVAHGPESLRERASSINDEVFAEMSRLAEAYYGELTQRRIELVAIACQESPYGLVRRYIGAKIPVPEWLDEVVRASAVSILKLG